MCKKQIYSACLLVLLGLFQASVTLAGNGSLVGWWKFDETSGTIAHDSSGYGNDGVLHGGLQLAGGGLEFDGIDDYVDCGDGPSLNITGEVTVMAWIRLAGPAPDRKIAGNQDGITGGYKFGVYSNLLEFEIRTANNAAVLNRSVGGGTILEQDVYYHVAGVYSQGDYIRTYVNGVLDRELSTAAVLGTSTGTFKIGREPFSDSYFWLGFMEDVRVYSRALTQDEIGAIARGEESPFASNPNPADGAICEDTWVTLTWTPGADAVSHDVYFGDNFEDVNDGIGGTFRGNQTWPFLIVGFPGFPYPDGLVPDTTYYWRIDEVNEADPNSPWRGDVWRFTIGYEPDWIPGEIALTFEAADYEIEQDEQGEETILMQGFGYTSSPGDPMLPCRSYDVVVPPNIDWETVGLELSPEIVSLPERHKIKPAAPFFMRIDEENVDLWGVDKQIIDGRNIKVYEADALFPAEPVAIYSQSQMRKWRFLRLEFTPIQYNPVTGELFLVSSVEVRLTFLRMGGEEYRTDPLLRDNLMDEEARERFINFQEAQEWYQYAPDTPNEPSVFGLQVRGDQDDPDYAIITTNAIVSGSQKLNAFVNHKKSLGHTVGIYTENDYGTVTGAKPNGTAEKIRKWLQDNYSALGIKWVLLIGNPDPDDPGIPNDPVGDVPMKMCRPNHGQPKFDYFCPTDHFYADLTGDWDVDGDEIYGEQYEGDGGGVDFTPEVLVGRIPVYGADYGSLDKILQKIIDYEKVASIPNWRRRVLLPMPPSDPKAPGYNVGEDIKKDLIVPAGLGYYRLYDHSAAPTPEAKCTKANVIAEWKKGYGLVTYWTHGNKYNAKYVINKNKPGFPYYYDTATSNLKLDNNKPSFTLQASCNNGMPDVSDNLQYELLKHGAVGTVSATRGSIFSKPVQGSTDPYTKMVKSGMHPGDNQHFSYFYTKHFLGGMTTGQALLLKTKDLSKCWVNNMIFNIYGDPTGSLYRPYVVAKHVDVVPVLDTSGSMQGYTSSSQIEQKITALKKAAKHFTYVLDRDEGHQMGLVSFSTKAHHPPMKLQPFDTGAMLASHNFLKGLSANGMTSIGGGLEKALDEFAQRGKAANRRVILLVTDGMENTSPMIKDVEGKVVTAKTVVYALGLGYSYGIDAARLAALANKTNGDYRVSHDLLIYHKFYLEMLGGAAASYSVANDPVFELDYGQSEFLPVTIGTDEEKAIFTAYWLDVDYAIALTVYSPGGNVYDISAPEYIGEERYCLYKIDLSNVPLEHRMGEWVMEVRGVADARVRVSASAFVRPGPRMTIELDPLFLTTGNPMLVMARLENNGLPITGADVVAHFDRPQYGFGNVMNENPVDANDLNEPAPGGDSLSPLQQKVAYLRKQLGAAFMPRTSGQFVLYDDGTHGDADANDGVYTSLFNETVIPGSYTFHCVASNIPCGEGFVTTREWTKSLYNEVSIDPDYSDISIQRSGTTADAVYYDAMVVPMDMLGNYLGPGHSVEATVVYFGGKRQIELTDNMDGAYSKEISVTYDELQAGAELEIYVDGQLFFLFPEL